jgi:hypothetical protein
VPWQRFCSSCPFPVEAFRPISQPSRNPEERPWSHLVATPCGGQRHFPLARLSPRQQEAAHRHRTALRCATPASIATSTRPARSMNRYPHPRLLPVLRHLRGFLVSSGQNLSHASLSSPHISPREAFAPLHPALRQTDPTQLSLFMVPLHPLRPIQGIAFHEGDFLQVAVSEAPLSECTTAQRCAWALKIQHFHYGSAIANIQGVNVAGELVAPDD